MARLVLRREKSEGASRCPVGAFDLERERGEPERSNSIGQPVQVAEPLDDRDAGSEQNTMRREARGRVDGVHARRVDANQAGAARDESFGEFRREVREPLVVGPRLEVCGPAGVEENGAAPGQGSRKDAGRDRAFPGSDNDRRPEHEGEGANVGCAGDEVQRGIHVRPQMHVEEGDVRGLGFRVGPVAPRESDADLVARVGQASAGQRPCEVDDREHGLLALGVLDAS